jgi:hypothetical protein
MRVTDKMEGFLLFSLQAWQLYCVEIVHPQGHPVTAVVLRTAIK